MGVVACGMHMSSLPFFAGIEWCGTYTDPSRHLRHGSVVILGFTAAHALPLVLLAQATPSPCLHPDEQVCG